MTVKDKKYYSETKNMAMSLLFMFLCFALPCKYTLMAQNFDRLRAEMVEEQLKKEE